MSGEAMPRRDPPLGLRLGIVSSVIVLVVMGALVLLEQWRMGSAGPEAAVEGRTGLLLVDVLITSVVVLVALQIATRVLVGRPLEHLMRTVDRMEQGYWRNVDMPRGAWEMRWLAWKFQGLGERLESLVRSIVEAQAAGETGTTAAQDSDPGPSLAASGRGGAVPAVTLETIERRLAGDPRSDARWAGRVSMGIAEALGRHGVEILAIEFRRKDAASAWWKMREKRLRLDDLEDLFAFRVIVPDEASCYAAIRAIHAAFEPDLLRFKDYVRSPKPNGYRSIHTSVADGRQARFEVQVRSVEMHEQAIEGTAAHWRYKAWFASEGPSEDVSS